MLTLLVAVAAIESASAQPARAASRVNLPRPSGRYAVGTVTMRLTDSTRATSRRIRERPLALQVWYPANKPRRTPAEYLSNPGLLDSMVSHKYLDLDSTEIRAWSRLKTQSFYGAEPANAASSKGWPVVVLSHGLGVARSSYTSFAQELASRGYAVLTVDHPTAVAMIGHSLGGAAALEACRIDTLFRACLNMDGDPFGAVEAERIGKPTLVLLSEPDRRNDAPPRDSAEAGRRERFAQMGRERDSMWTAICSRNGSVPCSLRKLRGTGHMSFTDALFVAPSLLRGVGATAPPHDAFATIVGYLTSFLNTHLAR